MFQQFKPALLLFALLTGITGVLYPLVVTGLAQLLFPHQANASLIRDDQGRALGSELIGQAFSDPGYFWGRPSATAPYPYNAAASSGSNLGPANPALADAVRARIQALRAADPGNAAAPPVDLVTASGSGLDPHISPAAARHQIGRVARERNRTREELQQLVDEFTEGRQWLLLGEPRVHVLRLNLELDRRYPRKRIAATAQS